MDKGWVLAKDLRVGDELKLADGEEAEVKALATEELSNPIRVYNFEVQDWHTYFVSSLGVLVHNTCMQEGSKTDFYVMPSGQAVPSTGYRYMSENAPYLDELSKTMVIPENPNGTYFSFDKFDVASPGKLQVPHDASVRGSFDTLQIIDDLRVPNGNTVPSR